MSVMRDQCDARPTVTFPVARHHQPLAGTKLYCLVTVLVGQQEGHPACKKTGCWFVGGGDLTGALHDL